MAKETTQVKEREYVIPLRKEWTKVPRYKRTAKSVKAVKEFVARHMRVEDRDLNKVRLDSSLNNEMWYRGSKTPMNKVKVRVRQEGDIVRVELAEMPEILKFQKAKVDRRHIKADKKAPVKEEKTEVKTEEEKKAEKEKNDALAAVNEKAAESMAKAQKHSVGKEKDPGHHRMALKK